jgi:hypothetical protein
MDADPANAFDIGALLNPKLKLKPNEEYLVIEADEEA